MTVKTLRLATFADYRVLLHKGKIILADCIGQNYGVFDSVEAAIARARHLTMAELAATREIGSWDAKQSY